MGDYYNNSSSSCSSSKLLLILRGILVLQLIFSMGLLAVSAQEFPSAPFLDLQVLAGDTVETTLHPPLTDGGAAITSYKVDWDSNPGVHEVQTIVTSAYTGPNEVQVVTTTAEVNPEKQYITTSSTERLEVQRIRVYDATGGRFFLMLDTSSTGGSIQYSGYISKGANNNATDTEIKTSVEDIISALSNVDGRVVVTKSTVDANTYDYFVTFPASMGDVPLLVPNTDELEPSGQARIQIETIHEGNVIGGTYRLGFGLETTRDIPFDATEGELTTRLQELSNIGTVTVTRGAADNQRGYQWIVTFNDPMNSGNVLPLIANYTGLTKTNDDATNDINVTSIDGNELGGTFKLKYKNSTNEEETDAIPYNADESEMKIKLEALGMIPDGAIAVTRTGPDGQLGYSWTIQFLDDYYHVFSGNLLPMESDVTDLTGDNANATITEKRKGTIKEVQRLSIVYPHYGNPLFNETLFYSIKLENETSVGIPFPNSTCISEVVEIQSIRSTAAFTQATASQGDGTVSLATSFRLQSPLTGATTAWIKANPNGGGDCGIAEAEIESELEKFDEFFNVDVSSNTSASLYGDSADGCTWSVTFTSSQGDLQQLKVQAKNSNTQYTDPAFSYSSMVGDNTISTKTVKNGELDNIKAALELMPNVGQVTVTSMSVKEDLSADHGTADCTYEIVFDTKAGAGEGVDFPTMEVALYKGDQDISLLTYDATYELQNVDGDAGTADDNAFAKISQKTPGTSKPLGGYYALTFRGSRTGYLTYDASARDVELALQSLGTIGNVTVTRSSADENMGFTWSVTFMSEMGDLSMILFDNQDMTGTVPTGIISEELKGVFPPFNSLDEVNGLPLGSAVITNLDDLTLRVSQLEQGIAYYFRASAVNSIGTGPYGYSTIPYAIPEPQRPGSPTEAVVNGVDGTSVSVSFNSPDLDGGNAVSFYRVEYGKQAFQPEVQQVSVLCSVTKEIQIVRSKTDMSSAANEVQVLHLQSNYSGTPQDEIQLVQCDASGGTFRLEFNGAYSAPIKYTATEAEVTAALEQMDIINTVTISFDGISRACKNGIGASEGFTVTFNDVVHMNGNLPLMTATTNSLSGLRRVDISRSTQGEAPIGGTFRLSFRGSPSNDITVTGLTAEILRDKLVEMDTIPTNGVNVSLNNAFSSDICDSSKCQQYLITFTDANLQGDIEALEIIDFYNHVTGTQHKEYIFTDESENEMDRQYTLKGSSKGNEVGGKFRLSFRGHTTDEIEFNAADTVMKATLEQLPNIGTVTVLRTGPNYYKMYDWTITFESMPGAFPIGSEPLEELIPTYAGTITGNNTAVSVTQHKSGSDMLSGTFALTYSINSSTTEIASDIPVDASASELAAKLNALDILGTVSVDRSTLQNGYKWMVTFDGCKVVDGVDVCNSGDVDLMIASNSTSCPLLVTEVTPGIGPAACPETTSGVCSQLVTDLSGTAPYSHIVSNLVSGDAYYFQVSAHNKIGYGLPSITSPSSIVPTFNSPEKPPPVRLVRSCVAPTCTFTSITVEWDLPRENGGATVQGFELWMDDWAGGNPRLAFDGTEEPETKEFTVGERPDSGETSLTVVEGRSYRFSVRAINYCLKNQPDTVCYSPFSDEAVFVVRKPRPPLPPPLPYRSHLSHIGSPNSRDSSITIRWLAPQDNGGAELTGYEINIAGPGMSSYTAIHKTGITPARDHQVLEFTLDNTTHATFSNIDEGDVYRFFIVAQNSQGKSAGSPILSVVAGMPPGTDVYRNLTYNAKVPEVKDINSQQITVAWPMPSSGSIGGTPITGYKLFMYPGVGLISLANPDVVFQEVQTITTATSNRTAEHQRVTLFGLTGGNVLISLFSQNPQSIVITSNTLPGDIESALATLFTDAGKTCINTCSGMSVNVSETGSDMTWDIHFDDYDGPILELVAVDATAADGANSNTISSKVTQIIPGTDPITGTFTVSYNGSMSVDLAYNAAAEDVRVALEDLPGVGTVKVDRKNNLIGGLDRSAYIWTITFEAAAGDLPELYCTAGRLNSLESGVTIKVDTVVDGTKAVEVYDGTGIPDVRSYTVDKLVAGMTYAFKVAPINAIASGVLSDATDTVVASSGSSATYTTVSGSSLQTGITNEVAEQQIIRATFCGNTTLNVTYGNSFVSFFGNSTEGEVSTALNTLYGTTDVIEVYRTTTEHSIPDQVVWRVVFPGMGDVADLAVSKNLDSCTVDVTEFLKGHKNQFTIEPKQASGEVLRDVVTASGFAGEDVYFTEMYMNGNWSSDEGIATYNPIVYEIQSITIPTNVDTTLSMSDYATPHSTMNYVTALISHSSTRRQVQIALEALENIDKVDVDMTTEGTDKIFMVTFLSNLGPVPKLKPSDDNVIVAEYQEGICEVQTITIAADIEMVREKQLLTVTYATSLAANSVNVKIEYPPSNSMTFVDFPINSTGLENAIEELFGSNGAPLAVEVTLSNTTVGADTIDTYEIKLISPVGDAHLLTFTEQNGGSSLSMSTTESVKGVSPIDGTFTVFFEGQHTDDILFDASAADVKKALEDLGTIGTVDVKREDTGNGYKWTVSFIQNMGNLRMMLADPYRYEVQRIVTTGGSPTPLNGQFTISYGVDQVNVNFDASAEELRANIESLPSVGSVEVSKTTYTNGQGEWFITFRSLIGDVGLLGVSPNLLLGSDADVNIYEEIAGNNATLTGENPRLAVLEKTTGRPDYTGQYVVDTPGKYDVHINQLVSGGLRAQYYDNQWFYGEPSIEQIDPLVDFDWGLSLITEYSSDYVSVKWHGKIKVDKTELYTFYVYSDDRATVSLNHQVLIASSNKCCVENRAEVTLTAGVYNELTIEYTELTGTASIQLMYSSISVRKQIVPTSVLYYTMPIVGSPFTTSVVPGAADYPYTTAYGPGLQGAITGTPTFFYIQTKDTSGNNQTVDYEEIDPLDLLSVKLTGGSHTANTVYFPVLEYTGNGLFKASYTPLNSGAFTADITMGSRHIQCGNGASDACSPFTVAFEPGPTVPQTSEVESPSFESMDYLVEAVAGEFGYFYIQAKDAYGNNAIKGGDDFHATFTNKANPSYVYRGNVDDHGDGTYTVHYTIPVDGEYDVAVTLQTSGVHTAESLLTCTAASGERIFDRIYNGKQVYQTPSFCTHAHPTLLVVHNDFHAPSSTYVDGDAQTLAYAVTGIENSLHIEARDQFGNLRKGDNTSHFYGYQDGVSDYFIIEFTQVETNDHVRVSTAIDVIESSANYSGYFELSFGGRRTYDIPSSISAEGLEMILEALHDFKLDVVVKKSFSSTGNPRWEIMFLTMLNVWQSMPPAGPATDTKLTIQPASNNNFTYSDTLSITRPASKGVYDVSFTLWHTGTYMTRVTSNGVDISGSPTTTTVTNAPVDPTSSYATGTGLVGGVAGEPIKIQIQAMDTRKPEVQTIMITSALDDQDKVYGTFTLGFKGENTSTLNAFADASEVETALENLYSIGDVNVVKDVYGGAGSMKNFSIWTVSFSGSCSSEVTCPVSLGDEPMLYANTENLLYDNTLPGNPGRPSINVIQSAKGYAGNKRLTNSDLNSISVDVTPRTTGAPLPNSIGMYEIHEMECVTTANSLTDKFTIQFLNQTIILSADMTTTQFRNKLEEEFKEVYEVNVTSSNNNICADTSNETTTFQFYKPWGQGLPLMQVIHNENEAQLSITFKTKEDAIDSIVVLDAATGLYEVTYTPIYKGQYDIDVKIENTSVATDFRDGIFVTPALEYSATSDHNISQVNREDVREYFTVQFRDRFGNELDSGVMDSSKIYVSMKGTCDICQSDNDTTPITTEIPVEILDRTPYTNGVYTFTYDPTAAGSYQLNVELMTKGGLLATYYKSNDYTVPVLASVVNFHDGVYHDPYWCDGLQVGNISQDWKFTVNKLCDLSIEDCGCDSTRLDRSIDFSWGDDPTLPYDALVTGKFPNDFFSIIWEGFIMPPGSGEYVFNITADYGVVFELNGVELLNQIPLSAKSTIVTASLKAGEYHKLRVKYVHNRDDAYISILWSGPGLTGQQVISADYLYYKRHIINSPITVEVYPGAVYAPTSSAVGSGLTECTSMEECSFVIQARDEYGNNIFNDGGVEWNISITGFNDWAGYEPHLVYRINDDNYTGYASVDHIQQPLGWEELGNGYLSRDDTVLSTSVSFLTKLSRGDSIKIGEEVMEVDTDEAFTYNASRVPLSRRYIGDDYGNSSNPQMIYKLLNCTTGKYRVTFTPAVRGYYTVNVLTKSVNEIQFFEIYADQSYGNLNGTFTLTPSAMVNGYIKAQTTDIIRIDSSTLSADIETALEALEITPDVSVSDYSYSNNTLTFKVQFNDMNQDMPMTTVDSSQVTGNDVFVRVTEELKGSSATNINGSPFILDVQPNITSGPYSRADGQGLLYGITGQESSFTVQSKDAWGNDRRHTQPQDIFKIHAFEPALDYYDPREVAVTGDYTYLQDGLYEMKYKPLISGEYTLVVMVADALEVQNITVEWANLAARTGYFSLSYGCFIPYVECVQTKNLAWDADANAVKEAVESLPGVGKVHVNHSIRSDKLQHAWEITYLSACDKHQLVQEGSSTIVGLSIATTTAGECSHISTTTNTTIENGPILNQKYPPWVNDDLKEEAQEVKVTCSGDCQFKLSFRGVMTPFISVGTTTTDTVAVVEGYLNNLISIGDVDVTLDTSGNEYKYDVTFLPSANDAMGNLENYGDLPNLVVVDSLQQPTNSFNVRETTKGVSPFKFEVEALVINAARTTAVDSDGVAGSDGLTTGIYLDSSAFRIESRDVFDNRVLVGPINEVQIIETYTDSGLNISGTFTVSYKGHSVQLEANAGIDVMESSLESLPSLGAVNVDTNSVKINTTITATAATGSTFLTGLSQDPAHIYEVGDWIRVGPLDAPTGPVFTVAALDTDPTNGNPRIMLSSPYREQLTSVQLYKHSKSGYQYIITFDSNLGDLPDLTVLNTLMDTSAATANVKLTACNSREEQVVDTSASTTIDGTFYLTLGESRTPDLPSNMSAAYLKSEMENLPGIYTVDVTRSTIDVSVESYSWTVSFVAYDEYPKQLYAEGALLRGQDVSVSVTKSFCPYTSQSGENVFSAYGVVGETFVSSLQGTNTDINGVIRANVTYDGNGMFDVVYKTPRVGNYNLTVAKAKRGGLVGEYFNNRWMYGEAVMIRTDPMINFMWGAEHAITESGKDYISVRWTGYVLPTFSEVYDFSITVNDGVRLWVDDYLIIDQYENEVDDSDGSIVFTASTASTLFANQLSSIKVEFRENTGIATAILSWSSASQPIEIVPGYRLFSDLEEIYGSPFMISPTARKPTLVQDVKLSINAWDEILVEFVPPIDDGGSDITSYTVEWFSARPELKPTLGTQTIMIPDNVVGGTFRITGYAYDIPFDVEHDELELIVERIEEIGDVEVVTTVGNGLKNYTITFETNIGVVSSLHLVTTGLILEDAAGATISMGNSTAGNFFFSDTDGGYSASPNNIYVNNQGTLYAPVNMDVGSKYPAYTYVIKTANQSSAYTEGFHVRVSATNSEGLTSIPTKKVTLKPMAVPDAPAMVEVLRAAGSDNSLIVYWTDVSYPEDRGADVTHFVVQWSKQADFSVVTDEHEGPHADFSDTTRINVENELVRRYNITGLNAGETYYIRVCAKNTMGRGAWRNAAFEQFDQFSIEPRLKANAIVYGTGVQISTIAASSFVSVLESSTSLKVTFNEPDDFHGSTVDSYLLEWWVGDYTKEVMTLVVDDNPYGTFKLKYNGDETDYLHPESSSDVIRTALENLADIRSVQVIESDVTDGKQWNITFLQDFPSVHGISLEFDDSYLSTGTVTINVTSPSVLPQGYNSTVIPASAAVDNYAHVIQNLPTGNKYKARVSALNAEGYSIGQDSFPTEIAPPVQKPSEPLDVSLHTYSASALKILYKTPESDGGDRVSKYKIEWDLTEYFNSSAGAPTGNQHKVVSGSDDCTSIHCSYIIHTLEKGVQYYARVFSYNSHGYSEEPSIPTEVFAVPMTQPSRPESVTVTSTSRETLSVSIAPPVDDGGAAVEHYKVEWAVLGAEAYDTVLDPSKSLLYSPYSVQVIQTNASAYDLDGYFYVQYGGFTTEKVYVTATALDMQNALKNIPTAGDVSVVRTERKEHNGYDWTVTFHNSDWMDNTGKLYEVPQLTLSPFENVLPSEYNSTLIDSQVSSHDASITFSGTNAQISTKVLVSAMHGYAQQAITVRLSAYNTTIYGTIGGTFSLSYNGESTATLNANASAAEIKTALMSIEDLGEVLVRRRDTMDGGEGFVIYLTYVGNLGPVNSMKIELKNIKISQAGVTAYANYTDFVTGSHPIMEGRYYGSAIVPAADLSSSSDGNVVYEIADLERGLNYYVRVSAWNGAGSQYGHFAGSVPALHVPVSIPVVADTVTLVNVNDKALDVVWNQPTDIGGSDIKEYLVEYDTAPSINEVQSISITSTSSGMTGSFCLAYGGFSTSAIPYDASETRLSSALESLNNIGTIDVTRSTSNADGMYGITWIVTFVDNVGDLSEISFSCNHLVGGTITTTVNEMTAGQAVTFKSGSVGIITMPLGSSSVQEKKSVQKITVNATSTDLNGKFYVKNSGELSKEIDVYSSADEMKEILEDMLTIDKIEVSMIDLTLENAEYNSGYGRSWFVTFTDSHYQSLLVSTGGDSAPSVVSAGYHLKGSQAAAYVERVVEEILPTQTTISSLTTGTHYVARLKAYNGYYWSSFVSTKISLAPTVKVPDAPINVYIRVISQSQITVHWDPPNNDGGAPITGYSVQWSTSSGSFGLSAHSAFVSTGKTYLISNLVAGTEYKVRVASYNHVGYSPYTLAQLQFQWQTIQTVTITGGSATDTATWKYTDGDSVTGREWSTEVLKLTATEQEVRDALQRLSPIRTVLVKKFDESYSYDSNSTMTGLKIRYRVMFVDAMFADKIKSLDVTTNGGGGTATVELTNVGTNVLQSLVKTIETVPSAPENIKLVSVSTSELGVYWDAPLYTGGVSISRFLIEWSYDQYFSSIENHEVVGYATAKNFNPRTNFAYQIVVLTQQKPVYVRVSAMNEKGFYSFAKHAWPLNATTCDTMPTHCGLTPTAQILHVVNSASADLASSQVANRLDVQWVEPLKDQYGFSSATSSTDTVRIDGETTNTNPAFATTMRIEWATDTSFTNPVVFNKPMIINDDIAVKCDSGAPCAVTIGTDVQNISLVSNNGEVINNSTGGEFAVTYVGKHSTKVNIVVRQGSTSITVLDTDTFSAAIVGDVFRIAGDVYQIIGVFANGAYDIHIPFKGGFSDVTVGYYAPRPSQCVSAGFTASEMSNYLNNRDGHISHSTGDLFEVAKQTLSPGVSWIVTFKHEIFQDEVDNFVLFTKVGSDLTPPTCASSFHTITSGVSDIVAASVNKIMTAGSLPAGKAVFVRFVPINSVGIGPDKVASVSNQGLAIGSIVPRSPPGLPENVHVYQVPTSVGDELKVTWRKGEEYGGPLIDFRIQYQSNNATDTSWQEVVVPSIVGVSEYNHIITTEPYCNYLVRVQQRNDQGVGVPQWATKDENVPITSITTSIDWTNGTQRAIPTCEYGLDECDEPAYGA